MLNPGKIMTLEMVKMAPQGAYLAESSNLSQSVLLPKSQVPSELSRGGSIDVFIYRDSEDRLIATTARPKLLLHEAASLTVKDVTPVGAFLDWGLEKDLFLPYKEQIGKPKPGDTVLVALYVDKSSRLCATMKVYDYLRTDAPYKKDDTVFGTVYECSENFGVFVAVDNRYSALIPKKEVFRSFRPGETVEARVSAVKPDGKLDLSLRQKSYLQLDEDALMIYRKLLAAGGFLPFHDKSDAEEIKKEFSLSKNAFKRAVGHLMKDGKVKIKENGIEAVHTAEKQEKM